jgi:hypothetical protein
MSNGCPFSGNGTMPPIADWNGLHHMDGQNPLDLLAFAQMGATVGSYADSSVFNTDANWELSPLVINAAPTCTALETDNFQMVADASQWNFKTLTADLASGTAFPLRNVIVLRGGKQWINTISINFGVNTYTGAQLSFLFNAGSMGCACGGKLPVISLGDGHTGIVSLKVTCHTFGTFMMGLRTTRTGPVSNMFPMIWVITP